jgi:hypothetical protein
VSASGRNAGLNPASARETGEKTPAVQSLLLQGDVPGKLTGNAMLVKR